MTTFVVAHGAWSGAWGWDRVAEILRSHGHRVHVPTLSGLGERAHLAKYPISLTDHVDDIVNEMVWHDLADVVLVGHSYGGLVVTGAIEKAAERVASVVYLDAFIPEDGQSFEDFAGEKLTGPLTPAPEVLKGEYSSEAERQWIEARSTAQPTGTFTEKLRVSGAYLRVARKTFIVAAGWDGPFANFAAPFRDDPSWSVHDLPCGHDVPQLMPNALAALLEGA